MSLWALRSIVHNFWANVAELVQPLGGEVRGDKPRARTLRRFDNSVRGRCHCDSFLERCLLLRGSGGTQLRHKQLCLALPGLHLKCGAKGRGGGAGLKTYAAQACIRGVQGLMQRGAQGC